MNKKIAIIFLLIFIPYSVMAAVSVKLQLDRHEASLVDSIRLTVRISGAKSSYSPRIKGLNNFYVEKGGTSSQTQIINNKISSSLR